MKRIFILFFIFCFSSSSIAQVYKCENNGVTTYSQTQCGEDAVVVQVKTNGPVTNDGYSDDQLVSACVDMHKRLATWKDVESLRAEGFTKSWVSDDSGPRHILTVNINAKNSYGGYESPKPYICFLNHSGNGFSKVQKFVYMDSKN
jgi:hypothetical protein